MSWKQFADEVRRGEDRRDNRDDRDVRVVGSDAIGAIVPNVPNPTSPVRALSSWRGGLTRLDHRKPPPDFTSMRWCGLLDDAEFIFNSFGAQLAREGWSALDVFGVLPWREGGGVLLDRLHGARNLKLDGEGRAFWSRYGVTFQTSRGASEHLVSSGLVLIWELPR